MKTLQEYLIELEKLQPERIVPGLERIKKAALALNILPLPSYIITIAGTNGKGSCVALLEAILLEQGYSTGAYISPHLISFCERIRIQGQISHEDDLTQALALIFPLLDSIPLSYFEVTTLAALLIFKKYAPDFLILEVGMGGRLDAVNVVDAQLTLITSIGFDHSEWLGSTLECITLEKLGICRKEVPLISGVQSTAQLIANYCQYHDIPLFQIGRDFSYEKEKSHTDLHWSWSDQHQTIDHLPKPKILIENAACVLMIIRHLERTIPTFQIEWSSLKKVLPIAGQPGRLQICHIQKHTLLLDVSHNEDSIAKLIEYLNTNFKDKICHAIFGLLNDKKIDEIVNLCLPIFSTWRLCQLDSPRSFSLEMLQEKAKKLQLPQVHFYNNVADALHDTLVETKTNELIVVFGSFHTVAPVIEKIHNIQNREGPHHELKRINNTL
jgi:dihydrofolate synthase / folylpolyglutamate synthase